MRINQYIAQAMGVSRREGDDLVASGVVTIDGSVAMLGAQVENTDKVEVRGKLVEPRAYTYVLLNKPVGYVCSRAQQGKAPTIYELLPSELSHLKPVGRLDKETSGLLLMTNDGLLANKLTHPSFEKIKIYIAKLDRELSESDIKALNAGIKLDDGTSKLQVEKQGTDSQYRIVMSEGRNRQIRRTFRHLGYEVTALERIEFAGLNVDDLNGKPFAILGSSVFEKFSV